MKIIQKIALILILITSYNCKAQTIVDLEGNCTGSNNNTYYKDINDNFNHYEGTWKYQNGNEVLLLKLRKVMNTTSNTTADVLIGEYQYINSSGIEKINTLSNFNINNIDQSFHSIFVNCIDNYTEPICDICDPSIKRILGIYDDPDKDVAGSLHIGKALNGGQEVLKIFIITDGSQVINNSTTTNLNLDIQYVGLTIPNGWYTLLRQ